jgi:hypothetical protein
MTDTAHPLNCPHSLTCRESWPRFRDEGELAAFARTLQERASQAPKRTQAAGRARRGRGQLHRYTAGWAADELKCTAAREVQAQDLVSGLGAGSVGGASAGSASTGSRAA